MKSLDALLTHARQDGLHENRAKWRNAHRANFIRGKYTEGAMVDLGKAINRSKETMYKWGQAAEFYTLLVKIAFQELPAYDRKIAMLILRRAVERLSPWFFLAALEFWSYRENIWNTLGDLESALEAGWSTGKFRDEMNKKYNPAAPTREQQADKHLEQGLYLLQTTEGDSPEAQTARFKGAVMGKIKGLNGAQEERGQWAILRAFLLD